MDLNEALGKITDPEVKAFFEKMVKDQNGYITKLEKQLRETSTTGAQAPSGNSITQAYIEQKMREEAIQRASSVIIDAVGKEVFDAVKPDFDAFLEKNLKVENAKVDYVIDAFNLVYGRCLTKKDHPVHLVGKAVNPNGTPAPQQVGTNGQQVAAVENIIAGQPQVMSGADQSAGQGVPGTQGEKVKGTRDALSRLRDRFNNAGGNKFQ